MMNASNESHTFNLKESSKPDMQISKNVNGHKEENTQGTE